jgi:hypothetical protein
MKLTNQNRVGLFPECNRIAPVTRIARATIPVVEALKDAGAKVTICGQNVPNFGYGITLAEKMPEGIVAVRLNELPWLALRMNNEPEFPNEIRDSWCEVDWMPCPVCGAPVVWYEAGYVPGYRVCTQPPHHHCLAE